MKNAVAVIFNSRSVNPRRKYARLPTQNHQARKTIKAGCEACPDNEDVWLEGARLQTPENAKTVLANAIRNLPTSVKIWLRAAELEATNASKKVTPGERRGLLLLYSIVVASLVVVLPLRRHVSLSRRDTVPTPRRVTTNHRGREGGGGERTDWLLGLYRGKGMLLFLFTAGMED